RGDVMMFLDERPDALRPRGPAAQQSPGVRGVGYGANPVAPMLSVSRSDSEEDVVGSFVGPRKRVQRTQHRRGSRSVTNLVTSASSTPPSAPASTKEHNLSFDQSLKVTGTFKTQQAMAFGHVPAATKVDNYHYMAASYLEILER